MVELIDNVIQLVCTAICTFVSFYHAFRMRRQTEVTEKKAKKIPTMVFNVGRREWILFGLFSGEYFLGDLFSTLYLAFFNDTPYYSYIPDISWYTSFLFVILMILYVSDRRSIKMRAWAQILIPLFTLSMGTFFVLKFGAILENVVSISVTTIVIWLAGGALELERQERKIAKKDKNEKTRNGRVFFYVMCLVIMGLEYGLWITSSFWFDDSLSNPYYWVDVLLSIAFIVMIFAVRGVVATLNSEHAEVEG